MNMHGWLGWLGLQENRICVVGKVLSRVYGSNPVTVLIQSPQSEMILDVM